MSLINDALKRAQEDKDRNASSLSPTLSPTLGDEPEPQVAASPKSRGRISLRVILLAAMLVAAGGWCAYHFRPKPQAAVAAFNPTPTVHLAAQTTTQPAVQATAQTTTQPALQATALNTAASQPVAAAVTRPRVRVVAPPPGGLDIESPTTQPAALPPSLAAAPTANDPGDPPDPLANLMIPLPGMSDTPGPAADPTGSAAVQHSTAPTTAPAAGAVTAGQGVQAAPATQPAAKPERTVAAADDVAQQYHVSCIMFSDQGSTAIINGSPVKVGATIRADGAAKSGLPEEAVVKRIDRNCVEVELGGERYLLRI
jgi:hypothetical protein